MEVSEELMLKWCNHRPTLVSEVAQLRHQGWYADVTLACEGRLFLAHKFVLAMCSDYFRNIFSSSGVNGSNSTLVIVLKDVACQDVEQLLDYMYTGIVAVDQACLTSLIKTAENLQIKGLALPDQLAPGHSVGGVQDLEHHQQLGHKVQQTASDDGFSGERDQNYDEKKELCNIRTDDIGPDVRLSGEFGTNRPVVSTRVGISPPSKRKRLHDHRQEYSPVSSANQQQVYSPQKVTTSPALQHLFAPPSILTSSALSSPANLVSCSSSIEPASMGVVTHQQPSTQNIMQSSKGIKRVPADQQSVLEQQSTVHQNIPQVDSQSQAGNSLNLSSQGHSFASSDLSSDTSSNADGGTFPKCKTLPAATSHGPEDTSYSQPEKVEIKQEAPDSEDVSGSSVSGSGTRHALPLLSPSKEQPPTECKEEPLHEDGEEGPSCVNAGEECWGTSSGSTLLAEAPTDEEATSDPEAPGVLCWAESQDKRYRCQWCSKSFRLSVHLKDHIRTHTGEKPYPCFICNKNFTQRSNLRTHLAKIHNEQLAYVKTRRGRSTSLGAAEQTNTSYSVVAVPASSSSSSSSTGTSTAAALMAKILPTTDSSSLVTPDTINVADIGIGCPPSPIRCPDSLSSITCSTMTNSKPPSSTSKRKRLLSATSSEDADAPVNSAVVPFLSKETLSYLCSSDSHFVEVPKLGTAISREETEVDAQAPVGVMGHSVNSSTAICAGNISGGGGDGTGYALQVGAAVSASLTANQHHRPEQQSSVGAMSATGPAAPLTPVPLLPEPLLKTLLKGGQNASSNLVNVDVAPSASFSSANINNNKAKTSVIFTTNNSAASSLLSNTKANSSCSINNIDCSKNLMGVAIPSTAKLVSTLSTSQALSGSTADDATISATFAFHPSGQTTLPANFTFAGKDITKSLILMDVANKGSSTFIKLPSSMIKSDSKELVSSESESFMVVEASGIVPESSSPQESVAGQAEQDGRQQHNMEILLQAIDMKETSPASIGKCVNVSHVIPVMASSPLPQQHGTNNRLGNSPVRPGFGHQKVVAQCSNVSQLSPMTPTISSPLFSSFAIQRPGTPAAFSISSSVRSHISSPLSLGSISPAAAAALSLPIYSLSPSNTNPLSNVASHIITVPTTSNALTSAMLISPSPPHHQSPTLSIPAALQPSSSHLLSLPTPSGPHTSVSAADAMRRRIAQVTKGVDAVAANHGPGTLVAAATSVTTDSMKLPVVSAVTLAGTLMSASGNSGSVFTHSSIDENHSNMRIQERTAYNTLSSELTMPPGHSSLSADRDKRIVIGESLTPPPRHSTAASSPTGTITVQTINVDTPNGGAGSCSSFSPRPVTPTSLQVLSQVAEGGKRVTYQHLHLQPSHLQAQQQRIMHHQQQQHLQLIVNQQQQRKQQQLSTDQQQQLQQSTSKPQSSMISRQIQPQLFQHVPAQQMPQHSQQQSLRLLDQHHHKQIQSHPQLQLQQIKQQQQVPPQLRFHSGPPSPVVASQRVVCGGDASFYPAMALSLVKETRESSVVSAGESATDANGTDLHAGARQTQSAAVETSSTGSS